MNSPSPHPDTTVALREVRPSDLPVFYEHQRDPEACRMAAFTAKDPTDRAAFDARWARVLGDDTMVKRTILAGGRVAGHIVRFEMDARPELTCWIGREYWGWGVATRALAMFLELILDRPLYARAAADNTASLRVLGKCGFGPAAREHGYANARGREIDELVLRLDA